MKRHSLREIMSDKNKLKINISDFEQLETVGLGSFGRVRLCRNIKTNKIYILNLIIK